MPVFLYVARSLTNSRVSGKITGDTPRAVRDKLRKRRLIVSQITPLRVRKTVLLSRLYDLVGRSRRFEAVNQTTRSLVTLLSVGVPLTDALATLIRQSKGSIEGVLRDLHEKVSGGRDFWESLSEHPEYFDAVYVNVARAGQAAGTMEQSLQQLVEFRAQRKQVVNSVRAALTYPAIVGLVSVGVLVFLLTFVVPKILRVLAQSGRSLPLPTRILVGSSNFLLHQWWLILAIIVVFATAITLIVRTHRGKLFLHKSLLRIPLWGPILIKHHLSRFSATLAALLESGLSFLDSLAVVKTTLTNPVLLESINNLYEAVQSGSSISAVLEKDRIFPPLICRMFGVGEQSGELERVLRQISISYMQEVRGSLQKTIVLLEPLLLILMATAVGFVVLAILLPILEVSKIL